jgi:hypothetical protein
MNLKQLIPLFVAAVFFLGAAYPKVIFWKVSHEPYPQQLIARLCLVALGLIAIWWYWMEA